MCFEWFISLQAYYMPDYRKIPIARLLLIAPVKRLLSGVYALSNRIRWHELTTSVNFDLTEVECAMSAFNLHNEISARRHFWGTVQVYSGSQTYNTWILSTHVVVPQGGCRNCRWHISQSDGEVIWATTWKEESTNVLKANLLTVKHKKYINLIYFLTINADIT